MTNQLEQLKAQVREEFSRKVYAEYPCQKFGGVAYYDIALLGEVIDHLIETAYQKGEQVGYEKGQERERERAKRVINLVLPLAKGYAAKNDVGSNQKYIEAVEDYLKATPPSQEANK